MEIRIITEKISMDEVKKLAEAWYGTMIKGTVDIVKGKVALGGDYHIESCEMFVKNGSHQNDVWGFNIRFEDNVDGELEFDSMVNIKPALGNKTRSITDEEIIKKAEGIIRSQIEFK
jgi:hypothetical protein